MQTEEVSSPQNGGDAFAPVVRKLLAMFEQGRGQPVEAANIPQMRRDFSALQQDRSAPSSVAISDVVVEGVLVRLYRPRGDAILPLHLYCHGGGFVVGSALSGECDGTLGRRAESARCIVASVEYRLAPEHPFPAAPEDGYRVLAALAADPGTWNLDARAISVGGMSAGGNIAAAIALMARDRGGPRLALQLLEIAGLDMTKSSRDWLYPAPGHDTTRERDLALGDLYLPNLPDRAHPYASPLFAADLRGVAPACLMNAEHDPRRGECESYATRLRDAGVAAIARTMAGHVHGSMSIRGWEPADTWQREANALLASAHAAALMGESFDLQSCQAVQ